jgi:flagellin FlaB
MDSTSIKYLSSDEVTTLTNSSNSNDYPAGNATTFNLTAVEGTDEDDSFGVLNSGADRYEVTINASAIESDANGLSTGDRVQLDITSQSGGTTQVILTMPQQLAGQEAGEPVKL